MNPSSPFDAIVLTAANETQAAGYRAQLSEREAAGLLPVGAVWRVIADPGGRRVGSGASTIAVLAELAALFSQGRSFAERFAGKRVLIAHSGGDARRLPAYAALGKIFLPLPCDITPPGRPEWERRPAALFDLLLDTLARLPRPAEGQIVVCAGDVLLTFDAAGTDLHTPGGITGLGFAAATDIGQGHGVYITPSPSVGGPVTDFLQKPSPAQMAEHGAIDPTGRILVDTGVLCFSPAAAAALLHAAGLEARRDGAKIGPGLHADTLAGRVGMVDLYQEIALALPVQMTAACYLDSAAPANQKPAARKALARFFEALRQADVPFNVTAVPDGEFFHIGTSRDLLGRLMQPSRTARRHGFENGHRTSEGIRAALHHGGRARDLNPTVFNTTGQLDHITINGPAYLEACDLDASATPRQLGGDNILVGICDKVTRWQGDKVNEDASLLELPPGIGLVCLPVCDKVAACQTSENAGPTSPPSPCHVVPLLFGVDDDNKATLESGRCRLLNQPIERLLEVLQAAGVEPEFLWPEAGERLDAAGANATGVGERSTWTARLWVVSEKSGEALALLLRLLGDETSANANANAKTKAEALADLLVLWMFEPRASWAELIANVDHERLLASRRRLAERLDQERLLEALLRHDDFPAGPAIAALSASDAAALLAQWRRKLKIADSENFEDAEIAISGYDALTQARLLRALALLATQSSSGSTPEPATRNPIPDYDKAALRAVARAVEAAVELPREPRPAAILEDQAVWVTAPARIDFAGGWSDTPPICLERGGAVLNAAVTLNQQYPVQVVAKLNDEGCIRLTSIDLGRQEVYHEAEAINGPADLSQWSSLAKAALVLSGIVPDRLALKLYNSKLKTQTSKLHTLRHWLDVLGGGLDLTLFSGLPKGSGMGTSSILGAATLACLARVLGRELTHAELIAQTSLLEQRLTSGGGWQDQIGGIVAGVKLIRTAPGLEQTPALQWTVFGAPGRTGPTDALQRRMLLYFTGQKRLAKNILQNVVGRYLAREPEMLCLIERLKAGAETTKQALEAHDLAAFAAGVAEYWELKKSIDPGSTNAGVEAILAQVRPYTAAHLLCGAGGGGFMLLIARDEGAADRIRRALQTAPPNAHARFFEFAIDAQGLAVTTL